MRNFLKMTKEEWKKKYDFLGFVNFCPECGKEADLKEKNETDVITHCMCDDCKLMWMHAQGKVL